MFTIKLGTGKTFQATAVEERLGRYFNNNGDESQIILRVECASTTQPLDWYRSLLQEPGALDTVQVFAGKKECLTVEGYANILELSQRLLASGDRYLVLSIGRAVEDAEVEQ